MTGRLLVAGLCLAVLACEDDLTVPGGCPEFCPGGQPSVRDTVLLARPGSDTAFFGYVGRDGVPALLVSNGLAAGEARAWFRFPPRSDSITIIEQKVGYSIDSLAVELSLQARDTTLSNLTVYYYRLPIGVDTLVTFDALDGMLDEAALIDSLQVPDSVRSGVLRKVFAGDALDRLAIPPADTGVLALGLRMRAALPSGIRLAAAAVAGGPSYISYVKAHRADSSAQLIILNARDNGYVRDNPGTGFDPDLLYLGRLPSARAILRFELPDGLRDPVLQIVRATLELTPVEPLSGLQGDEALLEVRGLVRDFGAKSTPSFFVRAAAPLPQAGLDRVLVDVRNIVELWRSGLDIPPAFVAALSPEGGSFDQPVFHSTRSGTGAPRLRITYLVPARVDQP